MIPDFQSIMLPILKIAADKRQRKASEIVAQISDQFGLSEDERAERIPSGRQPLIFNRVHWAITYLVKCGLLERPSRGVVQLTARGESVLATNPERIDLKYLSRFPEYAEFVAPSDKGLDAKATSKAAEALSTSSLTPDERLRSAHNEINSALKTELLARVLSQSPAFFEQLVVDLLVAMGFGGQGHRAEKLGRSGDGGIDGVISQDALGLDLVYVQAKRWQVGAVVGSPEIRNFFGSLDAKKASKGVLITTSSFTRDAEQTAERLTKNIVLIDGAKLSQLMVNYDVGVSTAETFKVKRIDEDFFAIES